MMDMTTPDSLDPTFDSMSEAITDFAGPAPIAADPPSAEAPGALGADQASDLFGHWADSPAVTDEDDALAVPKMFR
jgi:hypothetical protein